MSKKKSPKDENVLFGEKWREREILRKDYFYNQSLYGEFMQKTLFAGKMLKENGIAIFDTNQANKNFRNLLGLDDIKEIAGVYETVENGEKVQKIESIRKDNFYNAFHMPIWKNLSVADKVKSLEWMFENICEKYNIDLKHITYIPYPDDMEDYDALYGFFIYPVDDEDYFKPYLFINLNNIDSIGPGLFITTIAHELMHARQYIYRNSMKNIDSLYNMYLHYESDGSYFERASLKLDNATRFAFYKVCQIEKDAELQAIKYYLKYLKYNREKFGPNQEDNTEFEDIVDEALFDYGGTRKRGQKTYFNVAQGILTNEEIILKGQSTNLLKLSLFMKITECQIEDYAFAIEDCQMLIRRAKSDARKKLISKEKAEKAVEEYTKDLQELRIEKSIYVEKLRTAKSAFMDTIHNGKLPDYFPESNFELVGIKDKENKPKLPKWLEQNKDVDFSMLDLVREEANDKNIK